MRSTPNDTAKSLHVPVAGRARKLGDLVHEQLSRLIARGEFPLDCKLPPEGELALRFGVSRPVVRGALSRLRNEGLVRSHRGSGTIVVKGQAPGVRAFPPIVTIADLLRSYEYRITVETTTAELAAERSLPADVIEMREVLNGAAGALDDRLYHLLPDLNFKFHRAVAGATHNPYFVATLELIPNLVGIDHLENKAFGGEDLRDRMLRIHDEHVALCEAISAGNTRDARTQMRRHIESARDFVLEWHRFPMPQR